MPDRPANPPIAMQAMAARMPVSCYALFLVIDGRVENPEFVVWGEDDFRVELWKWKKKGVTTTGRQVEFWARKGSKRDFYRINPNAI